MTFDMTEEFESEGAKTMKAHVRPGDLVMVRHGNRFPIYRQAPAGSGTTVGGVLASFYGFSGSLRWLVGAPTQCF